MKIENKTLTLDDVKHRTWMQKGRLEHFQKIVNDTDKKNRLENQECVCCHYDSKMGGAAMTKTNCSMCEKEMHFGSTSIDRLCKECAKEHGLCKHCGADMDYKQRRKL